MTMKTVAVIGLGAMGSRTAQNLLNAGYAVVVHNHTLEKAQPLINQGAVFATSPRAAAEQSEVVISMVTDNEVSRRVWMAVETGAILGLTTDKIAIEMSTLTVDSRIGSRHCSTWSRISRCPYREFSSSSRSGK